MAVINNGTLITIQGVAEEVTAEELAQAIAIIKESKAPKFQLLLPWKAIGSQTTLNLVWNDFENVFEIADLSSAELHDRRIHFTVKEATEIFDKLNLPNEERNRIWSYKDEV